MIYPHQQKVIDYITNKLQADTNVKALLISGSISHGFNSESSDVDINIVVTDEFYAQKEKEHHLTYWEDASSFYEGGYIDGKFITLNYLSLVACKGNEPTRFALHDCQIAFDKTGQVADYLKKIGIYNSDNIKKRTVQFLSQLDAWKWYCEESLKKNNPYLLDLAVTKLILFAGRLILLDNMLFFPYHKWFIKVLEGAAKKPPELMPAIRELLNDKTADNVIRLYNLIKGYKDWTDGEQYSWPANFLHDVETIWLRQDDFIENI